MSYIPTVPYSWLEDLLHRIGGDPAETAWIRIDGQHVEVTTYLRNAAGKRYLDPDNPTEPARTTTRIPIDRRH